MVAFRWISYAIVVLGCVAFTLVTDRALGDEPRTIRVLSFNIHHAEGIDGRLDVARIAAVIRAASPDIVALQEVDRRATRTGGVDQAEELARRTGMQVVFGPNIKLPGGDYGNAVLSRWRIVESKNHPLPRLDDGEQRGVLDVRIELPDDGPTVRLLATHFDHRRDDAERLASVDFIEQLIEATPDEPTILAGDLNATPESEVLQRVARSWLIPSSSSPTRTSPSTEPRRQIDYVLPRPADRWHVRQIEVLDEATASDHRPIQAVLELSDEEKSHE